jgi:hypothetical protein
VDFFKQTGKWYTTEETLFNEDYHASPADELRKLLKKQLNGRLQGLVAVCLEPYVKHSYPVMVKDW